VREQLERARQMERGIRALKDRLAPVRESISPGPVDVQASGDRHPVDGADAGALRRPVDQLKEGLIRRSWCWRVSRTPRSATGSGVTRTRPRASRPATAAVRWLRSGGRGGVGRILRRPVE